MEKIIKLIDETQKANKKLKGKSKYHNLSEYKLKKLIANHKGIIDLYELEKEVYGKSFLLIFLIWLQKSMIKSLNKVIKRKRALKKRI